MNQKHSVKKPLATAIGAAVVGTMGGLSTAHADENPFGLTELSSGYTVAGEEGRCGEEGKCGEDGKDGEGKCGG